MVSTNITIGIAFVAGLGIVPSAVRVATRSGVDLIDLRNQRRPDETRRLELYDAELGHT